MSTLPVADLKEGNIFGRTIYPPSVIALTFILAKVWSGGGAEVEFPPPPKKKTLPAPEDKK